MGMLSLYTADCYSHHFLGKKIVIYSLLKEEVQAIQATHNSDSDGKNGVHAFQCCRICFILVGEEYMISASFDKHLHSNV